MIALRNKLTTISKIRDKFSDKMRNDGRVVAGYYNHEGVYSVYTNAEKPSEVQRSAAAADCSYSPDTSATAQCEDVVMRRRDMRSARMLKAVLCRRLLLVHLSLDLSWICSKIISIIIGVHIPKDICNHTVVMFPTSPQSPE